MGKTTIEWTDVSWNPIRGTKGRWHCTHVSEGCRYCYAERLNVRWGGPPYTPGADTFRLDEKVLQQPLHWKKPRKVFVCDMTDLFHEQIPDDWIKQIFLRMAAAEHCTFQVLTKRPTRMWNWFATTWPRGRGIVINRQPANLPADVISREFPFRNIWLGVSVEDQQTANERTPLLLQTPAAVRFVSYEPALGSVDFTKLPMHYGPGVMVPIGSPGGFIDALRGYCDNGMDTRIDWLIIGGESGPQARPFDLAWARSAIAQCREAKVPVFMKQVGSRPYPAGLFTKARHLWNEHHPIDLVYAKLQHPKGGNPSEWPDDVRVREWPR